MHRQTSTHIFIHTGRHTHTNAHRTNSYKHPQVHTYIEKGTHSTDTRFHTHTPTLAQTDTDAGAHTA